MASPIRKRTVMVSGRNNGRITSVSVEDEFWDALAEIASLEGPAGDTWPREGKLSALIVQTLRENAKVIVDVRSHPGAGTKIELAFAYRARAARTN